MVEGQNPRNGFTICVGFIINATYVVARAVVFCITLSKKLKNICLCDPARQETSKLGFSFLHMYPQRLPQT